MPGMNERFDSNGLSLACHIARPPGEVRPGPGVILCHGFPIGPLDAQLSAGTFPQLMDRVASGLACVAMTFNFRGCGDSEGDFSLQGWVDDLRNAISHLESVSEPKGVILVGTNTGGSIAVCVGADDPRVSALGLLSPRADFDDWAEHPRRFLEDAREIGARLCAKSVLIGIGHRALPRNYSTNISAAQRPPIIYSDCASRLIC